MSRGGGLSAAGGSQRSYGSTAPTGDGNNPLPDVGFAGFSPTELYSLSENITTNIYTVNSSWRTLERAMRSVGTHKDNQGLRDKIHVTQLSANQIIAATGKDLQRLSVVSRRGDKEQKLQVEKLTGAFKDAVARYSTMQKQVADKMKAHLPLPKQVTGMDGDNDNDVTEDQARLLSVQRNENKELAFQTEMLIERESRVRQIEGDILDVNQIMRELGQLVHQGGEAIDTIENSIETAGGNVEQGNSELVKAAQYQAKFRRKMLILLVIAIVIGIIITSIIVSEFKR